MFVFLGKNCFGFCLVYDAAFFAELAGVWMLGALSGPGIANASRWLASLFFWVLAWGDFWCGCLVNWRVFVSVFVMLLFERIKIVDSFSVS